MNGSFEDFLSALLAFESGWDRERYNSGDIVDSQLNQWAGGTVEEFFPQYSSWSELTDEEWSSMAYRSTNTYGFVGYQFGEALLIDLGYYDDDFYYGNGASTNTWDGTWTGKNGVDSLEDFMTAEAQEVAIREAFGYNLTIIESMLAEYGESLSDYLGQSISYSYSGGSGSVELTLTGILAGAHLRGAPAVVELLRSGSVSIDEYGTSILQYIEQFGDYDSPTTDELIAYFEDRLTGDEGLNPSGDNGTADVTADTADVVIDWNYGNQQTVNNFDPATGTIFIGWFTSEYIDVSEVNGSTVFSIPSNNQTVTLTGVSLSELDPSNFTILDSTAAEEILAQVGTGDDDAGDGGSDDTGDDDGDTGDDTDDGDTGSGDDDSGSDTGDDTGGGSDGDDTDDGDGSDTDNGTGGGTPVSGNGTAGVTKETATVVVTWAWGENTVITDFDPDTDTIFVDWFGPEGIEMTEVNGNVVFTMASNMQTITLEGVSLADLSEANFTIMSDATAAELLSQVASDPTGGGELVEYDSDGSDPATVLGNSDAGGVIYEADYNKDDIVGFDVDRDVLDFGDTSVHNMITTMTPDGELIVDNPWGPDMQILQGVQFSDLTVDNFGVVGNEHFRQDIGGVLSWIKGVGPREADTVYIRSHEYGVHEVIDNFDPLTMKISFLYFGTREQLSVEDTDAGLVISSQPSGQSFTFTGITLDDLHPGTLEFHHDQVMEDRLEEPFGFDENDVTLVSREGLLTPEGPDGQVTDGYQTRDGVFWTDVPDDGDSDDTGDDDSGDTGDDDTGDTGDDGDGDTGDGDADNGDTGDGDTGDGQDVYQLTWNWGVEEVIPDFDPLEDLLDFGSLPASLVTVSEEAGNLVFSIENNGGHSYILTGLQAEDLSQDNLSAPNWNGVIDDAGGVIDQLITLGFDDIA